AVWARPRLPGADGAARPPRGLRARGARVREAEPRQRGRVPAQGADAPLVVAPSLRGREPARSAAAVSRPAALASRAPLRERLSPRRAARDEHRSRRRRRSVPGGALRAGRVPGARGRGKAAPTGPRRWPRLLLLAHDR